MLRWNASAWIAAVGIAALSLVGSVALLGVPAAAASAPAISVPFPPNPTSGSTITVSGSGFPDYNPLNSNEDFITVMECSDPGGTVGTLPGTDLGCDGDTINPLPIQLSATGTFTVQYTIEALSLPTNAIPCDATHTCVLWAGVNQTSNFESPGLFAFSTPFDVGTAPTGTPETPVALALPIAAVALVGTVLVVRRRQGRAGAGA